MTNAVALAAAQEQTCVILNGGTAQCWGNNIDGQLGNGTTANSSVPVPVSGITSSIGAAAGSYHSCALLSGGAVRCWGHNVLGELGNGSTTNSSVPVQVTGL